MTSELIIIVVVVALLWLSTFSALGYWLKKRIDAVGQGFSAWNSVRRRGISKNNFPRGSSNPCRLPACEKL